MTLLSRGLVRCCYKLKLLYFHYHNAYGYKIWQDIDLPWAAPRYKFTRPFNHIALQDGVTS